MLHSGFVSADSVTRIWKGYVWRDSYYRYYLQEDEAYRINRRFTKPDGSYNPPFGVVWYRDFSDLNNRYKPRPDGLYEIRKYNVHSYYLPVNFSRAALDTLYWVPKDDRPYLVDPIVDVGEDSQPPAVRNTARSSSSSSTSSSGSGDSGVPSSSIQEGGDGNTGRGTNDQPLSNDASLRSLSVSAGPRSISFSSSTLSYLLSVGNDVSSVSVSAEANHHGASFVVSLNGTTISGDGILNEGSNSLVVRVTAEDGSTRSYTVEIERASPPSTPKNVGVPIVETPDKPSCDSDKTGWVFWDYPCNNQLCGMTSINCTVSGSHDNTGVMVSSAKRAHPHNTVDGDFYKHYEVFTFQRSGSTDKEQTFRFRVRLHNFNRWDNCQNKAISLDGAGEYNKVFLGRFRKGGSTFFAALTVCNRDNITMEVNDPYWSRVVSLE